MSKWGFGLKLLKKEAAFNAASFYYLYGNLICTRGFN